MNTKNLIRIVCFISLSFYLAACGQGERYLRYTYNNLDSDIADEYQKYADFDDSQKQQIEDIGLELLNWHRSHELPQLHAVLQRFIADVETQQVNDEQLAQLLGEFSNPFSFAKADSALIKLASFAQAISNEQVLQIEKALEKEQRSAEKEMEKWNIESENKEISSSLKSIFRDLDVYLNKGQLLEMKTTLKQRVASSPEMVVANRQWNKELISILQQRKALDGEIFSQRFITHWNKAETLGRDTDAARANQQVMVQVINDVLNGLNTKDRNNLIKRLNAYLDVLEELMQRKNKA